MRHIAVVGSGPAGYYTAEAAQKAFGDDVCVDIIDRLPVPYGLIRSGVAPDHQSIKAVARRFEGISLADNTRFVGNVMVGQDVSVAELLDLYDAVVLATGAPRDRSLDLPGAELAGVIGSAAFVGWYNGHSDFAALSPPLDSPDALVIGNGNVALDVARILAKTPAELAGSDIAAHALNALSQSGIERITLLGRRGPHQIAMTPKELGELGQLDRATPHVEAGDLPPAGHDGALEPGLRKSVGHLRAFADGVAQAGSIEIDFDFFAQPVAIIGEGGRAARVLVERTRLDAGGHAIPTGERYEVAAGLVVSCIGYKTSPIIGVPYDKRGGRFVNSDGRIGNGLYCAGWARRGPSGTIGTNRPDGYGVIDAVAADIGSGSGKAGPAGLTALLRDRKVDIVVFADWQRIEAAESARARDGSPREKITSVAEMLDLAHPAP
ncbi:FAD-dependent oxidoreductase [Sphingomonas sp. SUN039]|uniref:FAD-dependent oxidoreductase n=1 Tax=Sphingomonas sp. SUN039 TaxID=2937787 RepID=UPI00216484FF|nr:FAD-dependent oxidoreductase [Sphingomonas sp. SUN039]UVO55665.1 FAD-dependent oxidoreductase [Sphingomonas sp. SUN039]